jgi:hypothetical protein
VDPELLQQLFAQPDATAVRRPTARPPEGRGVSLFKNIVEGLDPTLGVAAHAVGASPERPSFITQALTGLLSGAVPAKAAKHTLSALFGVIRDPESLVNIARTLRHPKGMFSYGEVEKAISGATTQDLRAFDTGIRQGFSNAVRSQAPEDTQTAFRLLLTRNNAELANRAVVSGDDLAARLFEIAPDFDSMMADFMTQNPGASSDDFFDYVTRLGEGGIKGFVDYDAVGEFLHENLADVSFYKTLLGID